MPSPLLIFSHANGFPAGTYRQLFDTWRGAGYRVRAIDRYGHDPAYPVTNNWPHLRDQLLHFVQREAAGEPVHLVGHSLGGFLSLILASRHPALVRSLVLLDSPVIAGWRAHSLRMAKSLRLMHRAGPGRISRGRRWQWPSAEAAHAHFAAKHHFARWAPGVLTDYIGAGTEPDPDAREREGTPGAVRLAFHREVETQIYNTLPHHLAPMLRRHPVRCPVGFVAGAQSAEVRRAGLAATHALVGEHFEWVTGGHLFPMEQPDEAAAAVLRLLAAFEVPTRSDPVAPPSHPA